MSRQATPGLFGYGSGMSDGPGSPPGPPPEAVLLRLVRKASGVSLQQAAHAAGISKAWLSSVETGHDSRSKQGDGTRPVRASDEIIARLAFYLRISPERLEGEGQRPDAAAVLREMLGRHGAPLPPPPSVDGEPPQFESPALQRIWEDPDLSEPVKLALIALAREMLRSGQRTA